MPTSRQDAALQRIHVIGVAGSGKTTLARMLGRRLGVPAHDLDEVYYEAGTGDERPRDRVDADLLAICETGAWVIEGSFVEGIEVVLERAQRIVWLDVARRVAVWRIVKRHVVASTRGRNRHRGLRKLVRFVRFVARRYDDSRGEKERAIARFEEKVQRVRGGRVRRIVEGVVGSAPVRPA